jgi:phosphinothricin acetyltransferase
MPIRAAQSPDFESIAAITNHYILTTPIHFAYDPAPAAELRGVWEKNRDTHPYLVLTDGAGDVIGYARAYQWRTRAAYDRTAEVGIYIRHDLLGRGHGKPLYRALIDACRERGFHSLIGGIALPNEPSVRLHESLGFIHTGTVREAGWKFDRWHDVGFWQLLLREP